MYNRYEHTISLATNAVRASLWRIEKGCEGLVAAFITYDIDDIDWVCPICKTNGYITD